MSHGKKESREKELTAECDGMKKESREKELTAGCDGMKKESREKESTAECDGVKKESREKELTAECDGVKKSLKSSSERIAADILDDSSSKKYTYGFHMRNGCSSKEFPCLNAEHHLFVLHAKDGFLCLEYKGRSYREISFHVDLLVNDKKYSFMYSFSASNNMFYLKIESGYVKICVEQKEICNQFCGLINLGATCYINSLLQTLRYMKGFQKDLFETNEKYYCTMLKRVFYAMSTSTGADYTHVSALINNLPFVKSVMEHQDVHEFSKILFDKIEKENQKLIKENIEGKLEIEFRLKCGCIKKITEIYQDLQLNIKKEEESLETALNNFTSPEQIEEFTCEEHGKTSAVKRTFIKTTPKYLFLLINRFCFDWETLDYSKNNSFFSFPPQTVICGKKYSLYSVIVHAGNVSEGHFYAYIKIGGKFYKFNDTQVNEVLEEEAVEWNYGGENIFSRRTKNYSGYYLVYEETSGNNVYNLVTVPKILTDDPLEFPIKLLNNAFIKDYDGPGAFNINNGDYPLTKTDEITINQFSNISSVFNNADVFQLKENRFERVEDTNITQNEAVIVVTPGKMEGKPVFIKEFDSRENCNFPVELKMHTLTKISKLEDLYDFYGITAVFKEKYLVFSPKNVDEESYCSEITQFDQIAGWDILIITNAPKKQLDQHLKLLYGGRYIFVDVNNYKIPLFIPRNLGISRLKEKIKELLFSPTVKINPILGKCKKEHSDPECEDCLMDINNTLFLSFDQPIRKVFVGCAFGKNDINSINHVHPLALQRETSVEAFISMVRSSKYPCMKRGANSSQITVVHVWKESLRVKIYNSKGKNSNFEPSSVKEPFDDGGMVVLMDYVKNPMVVCFVDSTKKIKNYPLVIEQLKTIKEFREKYMILSNLYRNSGEIYCDEEIIDGEVLIENNE
ncbi:ubiquitin carboxyl-terminal hydrolase [Nucleospora cyclopteri]